MEKLPLPKSAEMLLDECRMVLPGIQALFGFQLIAVFNEGFSDKLGPGEQRLHLVATGLVAIAVALIMAPAALHRQTGAQHVSERFITTSSRLLVCSMLPLALGICLDFYLVAHVILESAWSAALGALLFAVFMGLWFGLPRVYGSRAGKR
jgi:uncharacterized PurR-regulated membrane protein YhhQ (DUF165 family)